MMIIEITKIKWIVEKLNPKVAPPQKKEQKQTNKKPPVICNLDTCLIKMIKTD